MDEVTFDGRGVRRFLVWTFAIAWALQLVVILLVNAGSGPIAQYLLPVVMFAPLLGLILSGHDVRGLGWRPRIRENLRLLLFSWLVPAALTAAGAALYFCLFPAHFDLSGAYLLETAGPESLEVLEAGGLTYGHYILINAIVAVTVAPLINMFPAMGEEAGWRGYLYPQLKAKFGHRLGLVVGGIVWGVWHWPLIAGIGYEYGTEYIGFPVVGMVLFPLVTIAFGALADALFERSRIIWYPAIFHGALNAAATIPVALCQPHTGSHFLLGPAPAGIIAALPFFAVAACAFARARTE